MTALTSRDRRTLLVGAITITSIILITRGIPAWYRWQRATRAEMQAALAEASISQAAVRNAPIVARLLKASERYYFTLASAFIKGDHIAVASASLASTVGDAATSNNMSVGALQVRADSGSRDGIVHVFLRGDATGDVIGVSHFVATIESGVPLLTFRELTLTQAEPGAASDHPETLRIEFMIEAIARSPDAVDRARGSRQESSATLPEMSHNVAMYDEAALDVIADSVSANDPFRLERKPSQVAFGTPAAPTSPTPTRPKIQLTLGGIVGGPPWHAVLNGVPGHEGSAVVAPGDTLGGVKVRAVRRDTVVVQGMDTTWTLTIRH